MFATTVPGLAPIARGALSDVPSVTVRHTGFDGRADLVLFDADRAASVLTLGLTEDVFVEVGRTLRSEGDRPGWIAARIWRPARVERALSLWAGEVGPLERAMTFRVIARVLQERSFQRTELRRQLTDAIQRDRPAWRVADPADLEVWISEYVHGRFVAGLRLSDVRMRQGGSGGRVAERPGALRPTVANAMVRLAGAPGSTLLDPCCGAGTILGEAQRAGWDAVGFDIDPEAVELARQNVPSAEIRSGDVRHLELADRSVAACVSNLPFGQQYAVQGTMHDWLRAATGEMCRVTRSGGTVVLLAPEMPRRGLDPGLEPRERYPIRLLGTGATIWVYHRA